MKIAEILNTTAHRPWELPTGNWNYYQEWNNAIFLHWRVGLADLRKCVPVDLEIDQFEGGPWISLVAFTMENIRPRHLPSFPPISNFHEINIRTYVKTQGKSGVYFLSIEAGNRLSAAVARGLSGLPYRYSQINRTKDKYWSSNKEYLDHFNLEYDLGPKQDVKSDLDLWLTERYALFQENANRINKYEIHHDEWQLKEIKLGSLHIEYKRFQHFFNSPPERAHYSPGVQVLSWNK